MRKIKLKASNYMVERKFKWWKQWEKLYSEDIENMAQKIGLNISCKTFLMLEVRRLMINQCIKYEKEMKKIYKRGYKKGYKEGRKNYANPQHDPNMTYEWVKDVDTSKWI